ncbi:MAG: WYL domain-containing protein [Myxococcota bacterium]|jgi:predicted DNA-binding transcriptional regulator YafY|nr:WYL domain-containing protein [Myxococcota bacterium]
MVRTRKPSNTQTRLIRLCELLLQLSRSKYGLTADELKGAVAVSRSTFHRDLSVLRSAGVPIELRGGRYRFLNASEFPSVGPSALQIASLRLARLQLAPLAGTLLLQEFDRCLGSLQSSGVQSPRGQTSFHFAETLKPAPAPKVLRTIEKALASGRRVCIAYRAATRGGATGRVHIEPLVVSVAEADPYVRAFCIERNEERTYKLSRIQDAELTRERATHRPAPTAGDPFAGALKAWSGSPHPIEVRLDANVAWLAREYPLPGQTEHRNQDGSVTVRATVAGLVEVRSRILAWGAAAEVVKPKELRETVRAELAAALRKYDGPGPAKASLEKSERAARRSLNKGETRAG